MIGPVFSREALTAPRKPSFYATRAVFVAGMLGILLTAWQVLVGSQELRTPGDLSRFGEAVFSLLAPLVLTVCLLFSALFTAASVSQEKDRKTLLLLLLSDLTNRELVLGKLLASMLSVLVVIAAAAPLLMLLTLVGGVAAGQVVGVLAVVTVSSLAAGSLGSTLALWREKTFQALALTALLILLWLVGWEVVASGALGDRLLGQPCGQLATTMSPWRAVQLAAEPSFGPLDIEAAGAPSSRLIFRFLLVAAAGIVLLNGVAIARVRVWNPSREARPQTEEDDELASASAAPASRSGGKARRVWDNPVLWREIRTWAYGKKILAVKLGYVVIFGLATAAALQATDPTGRPTAISPQAVSLTPMLLVSVLLVNAVSVTSITNERDGKALDLLLATDLTPKELIFGKLVGAAYNAKEMIVLPLLLFIYLYTVGALSVENLTYLLIGLGVINAFAGVLGLHAGMMYPNSRQAIATSLGTVLFLFLGVSFCMRLMLALGDSFANQFVPFVSFMLGGGAALFLALGWRNPSPAMGWACFLAPPAMFYAITSFLLGQYSLVFLSTTATFGFATVAMLVPALSEFDVATGRTAADDG